MRTIPLTQGKITLVSDCDYAWLMQWKWYAGKRHNGYYAMRDVKVGGAKICVLMHRAVAERRGTTAPRIDHRNYDSLDNRRRNLRAATNVQNMANRDRTRSNSTGFKGVTQQLGYSTFERGSASTTRQFA